MSDGNEIRSAQYTARCGRCSSTREITRAQVLSGCNPLCEHCGSAMVVYLSGGPDDHKKPARCDVVA